MIIKIVYKTKTIYKAYTDSATSIDLDKRIFSIGSEDVKINKKNTAYLMNKNGTTLGVLKGE